MVIFIALRVSWAVAVFIAAVADSAGSIGRTSCASAEFLAVAVFYALFVAEILRKAVSSEALHVVRAYIKNDLFAFSVRISSVACIALAVVASFTGVWNTPVLVRFRVVGLAARFCSARIIGAHYATVAGKLIAVTAFAGSVHICRILRTAFSVAHLERAFTLAESLVIFRGAGAVFRAGVPGAAVFYACSLPADKTVFAVAGKTFERIFGALRDTFSGILFKFDVIGFACAFSAFV